MAKELVQPGNVQKLDRYKSTQALQTSKRVFSKAMYIIQKGMRTTEGRRRPLVKTQTNETDHDGQPSGLSAQVGLIGAFGMPCMCRSRRL